MARWILFLAERILPYQDLASFSANANLDRRGVQHTIQHCLVYAVVAFTRRVKAKLWIVSPHPSQFQHLPGKCNCANSANCRK